LGLSKRIETALQTEVSYGIVRCFLGRLLLWKRTNQYKTALIDYEDRTVPSWSWMAGGIDFISDARQGLTPDPPFTVVSHDRWVQIVYRNRSCFLLNRFPTNLARTCGAMRNARRARVRHCLNRRRYRLVDASLPTSIKGLV
jgi:hypothetical protein